jgi:23S rRNA-/tRNA-specific pseudouridylate synthase
MHGRTHQIRLHCALLKMYILNDPSYGPEEYVSNYRQEFFDTNQKDKTECADVVLGDQKESMTEDEAARSICSYCQRGDKGSFSKSQLRHDGIWLHSYCYSMDDGKTKWSYNTDVPKWAK